MREHSGQFKVTISIERRPDGGLRAHSDDVPELVLSGLDPSQVMADILPAVETILAARMGCPVTASWLTPLRDATKATAERPTAPPRPHNPIPAPTPRRQNFELAAACA